MMHRWAVFAAALVLWGMGGGAARGEEKTSYPPEQRVKKFSLELSAERTEYATDYFNRDFFLGGDYLRTHATGEYQFSASAFYQLTKRLSLGARAGYTQTQLVDPLLYSDPRLFSVFYPGAERVIECESGASGLFCAEPNPIIKDILDLTQYSFSGLNIEQKAVPGKLGDLRQIPLSLAVRYDLMLKTRWRPFVGANIGYTLHSFTDDNSAARMLNAIIAGAPYVGTQSVCDYLKANITDSSLHSSIDAQLMCGNFNMPDGTVVPGLFAAGNQFFMQGMTGVSSVNWNTEVPNSLTWGLEGGFAWTLSKRWDFLAGLRYTWYEKKVRSTINGSDRPLYFAYADTICSGDPAEIDCVQKFLDNANTSGSVGTLDVERLNLALFDFIYAEPANFRLDVWQFSFGFKYTFGR